MTTFVRVNTCYLFIANVLLIYDDRKQVRAESLSRDLRVAVSAERSSTQSTDLENAESARQRNTKAGVTWCHVTRHMNVRRKNVNFERTNVTVHVKSSWKSRWQRTTRHSSLVLSKMRVIIENGKPE